MSPVRLERQGDVAVLSLERPEVHNVIDEAVVDRLESLQDRLDDDEGVRALIVTGAGSRTFCAGADLTYLAGLEDLDAGLELSRRIRRILDGWHRGPRPVIAAVNGAAFGGGCEILTACHQRIAAEGSRFSFRQAAMGLVTGWGGGERLIRLVGRSRALRLLLTADVVEAPEALALGLIDRVVPAERVLEEALSFARRIAENSPRAVRAFLELATGSEEDLEAREIHAFESLWRGEHFRGRVATWRERRR